MIKILALMTILLGTNALAGEQNGFVEADTFFNTATLIPDENDLAANRILSGYAIYSNEPTQYLESFGLIYVDDTTAGTTQRYFNRYFKDGTTSAWSIDRFISAFTANQSKYSPLQPSAEDKALATVYTSANFETKRLIRKFQAEDGVYLIDRFQCLGAAGCDLPYKTGGVFNHYLQNEIVAYSYFKLNQ